MVRWAYLIPRGIILALIALAVWVGSDPLCRRMVVTNLQNATGAKVEIGNFRYSLSNQKIFLKDLAFTDPRLPMQNLLQAEMAYVELDPARLFRRQIVIERGETSRIVFGAPRTESGALPGFPTPDKLEEFKWKPKQFEPIERIGLQWLDQFPPNNFTLLTAEDFELVQATRELSGFWETQLLTQAENIASLKKQRAILTKELVDDGNPPNPLRKTHVNTKPRYQVLALQTKEINARLIELERTAQTHRKQLTLAYNRDTQKLRQSYRAISFDSDSVSKLLLTKLHEERIAEIIGYFNWFRSVVPDPQSDFQPKRKRGVDIRLPGVMPSPGFLIKSIDLEGEGRFANRHFNFAGVAYNLTSEPTLLDQPASFELHAQGGQHLIVSCTLDRRNEIPIDSLKILCPDLELPEQMLGEERSMLVTMGPASRIQADIEIRATGNQLSGELVFRHSNVSLHVDKLHELIGGADSCLQLNQGLASIDRFESRVTLAGTIEDYTYQFQSDLGSRFAGAANQLLNSKCERTIELRKKQLQDLLVAQLSNLDNEILVEIHRLAQLLEHERIEIASRRDSQPQKHDRLPKIQ